MIKVLGKELKALPAWIQGIGNPADINIWRQLIKKSLALLKQSRYHPNNKVFLMLLGFIENCEKLPKRNCEKLPKRKTYKLKLTSLKVIF